MSINESYNIRSVSPGDVAALICFGKQEFSRTFGHLYPSEDLENYLDEDYSEELFNFWLGSSNHYFKVAIREADQSIVGYVLACDRCGIEHPIVDNDCCELKRLYIHPDCFGCGIAHGLMLGALEWLKSLNAGLKSSTGIEATQNIASRIILSVYSDNVRAQRFYAKYGFHKVAEYGFKVGSCIDHEFIFQLK
jgi:ribosomal protein S18 acetylase RimI-like enzyme